MISDRYPGYDILAQRGHWDDATRRVVLDRVHNVPPFTHFQGHARETLEALCARVIPQDHRPPDLRVPLAPWIDHLCQQLVEGFRFDDMPPNVTAWEWGLDGLDQSARAMFDNRAFIELDAQQQIAVLEEIRRGTPAGDVWQRLPAKRWWEFTAVRQIAGVYYSHPYAWEEIGFGGPAYPRGYFSLNHGDREPWEVDEVR
jgi:hypothetical protein